MTNRPFFHGPVPILVNRKLARDTYLVRLHAPALAARIRPGQFLMLRLPRTSDPLLGRPFALYDTVLNARDEPEAVDVVYLVVGKMTSALTRLRAGDEVELCGPLGNGFPDLSGRANAALV